MATVEQDPTNGPAPGSPGEDADEGTFRWPSRGVPSLFGRHIADEGEQVLAAPAWTYMSGEAAHPAGAASEQEPPEREPAPLAPGFEPGSPSGLAGGPEAGGGTVARDDAELSRKAAPEAGAVGWPPPGPADAQGAGPGVPEAGMAGPETGTPTPETGPGAPETGPGVPAAGPPVAGYPAMDYPAAQDPAEMRASPFGTGPPAWHDAGTAQALSVDFLMPGRGVAPPSGWRYLLYRATAGRVTARPPAAQRRRHELVRRARTPIAAGHHRVAVLSLKGGVGKTTTVMGLGSTLASLRGDRVIAVDANPDRGTLSDKLRLETAATVRDLVSERDQVARYADVRAYTTQAASRLEVLASDRDPAVSVAFSAEDYAAAASVLERYYSICLTDCGTGLLHSAMAGVLRLADQIVVVSTPSVDGARSASATLDWLCAHGYGGLVRDGVVALSMVHRRSRSTVDIGRLEQHFAARCRAVVRIPYDANLEEGAEVEIADLDAAIADAYLTLAAVVGDGFARSRESRRPAQTAG